MKKVFAVIMAIVVIIMFVFVIQKLLTKPKGDKIASVSYFASFENNKYGVIDSNGKSVIEPSYGEYIVVPNEKKDVFLCTYDVDYQNNTYKTKALNSKNEEIFKGYEQILPLDNLDEQNNVYYEDQVLKVVKNGKYGLINLDGKEILSCEYDNISALRETKNSILVEKDGKVGIVDHKGTQVIPAQYSAIKPLGEDSKLGYIVMNAENKYGVVDVTNKTVLENKYEQVKQTTAEGMYIVKEAGSWKVIKKDGTIVVDEKYDDIISISKDYIVVKKDNKQGVVNVAAEEVLPISYEQVEEAFTDSFIVKKGEKYGVVKKDQETAVEIAYEYMNYLAEGNLVIATKQDATSDIIGNDYTVKLTGIISELNVEKGYFKIRIGEEYKYYNFKLEEKKSTEVLTASTLFLIKQDGKYGYTDKNGEVVVEPIYDDAKEQNIYGYAAVKKDGKWGSLDKNGNVVAEPMQNLENHLQVDFIGNWYLGEDLNLKMYIK